MNRKYTGYLLFGSGLILLFAMASGMQMLQVLYLIVMAVALVAMIAQKYPIYFGVAAIVTMAISFYGVRRARTDIPNIDVFFTALLISALCFIAISIPVGNHLGIYFGIAR